MRIFNGVIIVQLTIYAAISRWRNVLVILVELLVYTSVDRTRTQDSVSNDE